MGITIKDIAQIAGVSTSTVSLIISGKGYVSGDTREKVRKIIDEYNYRPLRSARQLASNKTGNIGFIISDVHLSRSEAFYSRILLGAEVEAVICVNDTTALGCLQQLREQSRRIPEDIAVIGFDDNYYASVMHPPLSSIYVPKVEMGMAAMKLLKERIENRKQLCQTRVIPVKLVVRESSMQNHII
ncbi:MAG: LacI family DNA-binding transcriptional regulator [Candidatus Marinimicrobia bacterium]|nr:LacI family DNA-binding transcriptional regulator [Candidatus Neomarinimicrobiota bacterium]